MPYQFLAVHTFIAAVWHVGLKARGVAVGLVCLACVFITLWVAIGAGIHKNYETPTPVRNSTLFPPIPSSLLTLLGSVLVLDQPSVPGRTHWWGIPLVVDRIIRFGNAIHPAVFLGGRFLVGRQREQASLVGSRSEGRIHTAAICIGNASVSNRLSSRESRSQIFGH
jgi:hypothetical protein